MKIDHIPHPRTLLHVGPHAGAHHPALRLLLSVSLPGVALVALHRTDLIPYALLTSVAAVYGRQAHGRRRVTMQVEVACFQLLLVVLGATLVLLNAPAVVVLLVAAGIAGIATLLSDRRRWMPAGALFPTFAIAVSAFTPLPAGGVPVVAAVSVLSVLASAAVTLAWSVPARSGIGRARSHADGKISTGIVRVPPSVSMLHAGVCVSAGAAAGVIAMALGLSHPYWAVVSAVVPVFGLSTDLQLVRASHRLTGTAVGLATSAVLFLVPWSEEGILVLLAVLMVGTELMVGRNYSIALAFITPMTIGFALLGSTASLSSLLLSRAIETALGLGIVVILILVTHRFREVGVH